MRLDIFLKESRLVKRRPQAKEYCDAGRLFIDGKPAKASREISVGETLLIKFPAKCLTVRIESLPQKGMNSATAQDCYRITEERILSPQERWLEDEG